MAAAPAWPPRLPRAARCGRRAGAAACTRYAARPRGPARWVYRRLPATLYTLTPSARRSAAGLGTGSGAGQGDRPRLGSRTWRTTCSTSRSTSAPAGAAARTCRSASARTCHTCQVERRPRTTPPSRRRHVPTSRVAGRRCWPARCRRCPDSAVTAMRAVDGAVAAEDGGGFAAPGLALLGFRAGFVLGVAGLQGGLLGQLDGLDRGRRPAVVGLERGARAARRISIAARRDDHAVVSARGSTRRSRGPAASGRAVVVRAARGWSGRTVSRRAGRQLGLQAGVVPLGGADGGFEQHPAVDGEPPAGSLRTVWTLLETATWVCRSGSPARESRWVNAAATRPRVSTCRDAVLPAAGEQRVAAPARPMASATAAWCAASICCGHRRRRDRPQRGDDS